MPSENPEYKCYLAILKGDVLANLYQEFGTRLLESNVRSFLQQTGKVNKGIRDTIRAQPGRFLPYNNGLAATGSSHASLLQQRLRHVGNMIDGGSLKLPVLLLAKK